MKKQDVVNLVKYYVEKNDSGFRNQVAEIANDFEMNGDVELGSYLMDLISTTNFYTPQNNYRDLVFLKKNDLSNKPIFLPDCIKNDILGLIRSVDRNIHISKVLLYGKPGTGKTLSELIYSQLFLRLIAPLVTIFLNILPLISLIAIS